MNLSFNEKVYFYCKKIPKGKVSTYKKIALLINSPKSFRAVGNALNKNKNTKTIPCHRVIKSDGTVGGYAFGTNKKAKILKSEGIEIINNKINLQKYLY